MPALYIHLPFCARKCAYCDFASWPGREKDIGAYIDQVGEEMRQARLTYGRIPVETIYLGGGTPSLPPSDVVMHLLAMARARFDVDPEAEITIEANPGAVTPAKLRDYRDSGVNRISFGVQAFQQALLTTLGRIHTPEDAARSVEMAREAGFRNLSLDLMYGLPGQSMRDWVASVNSALALKPEHLSLYSLILEEGTPLRAAVEAGTLTLPDEEATLGMRQAAGRILARRGYERYEISNYCLVGRECRHNLTYWRRGDYLGLGCAAHSFMAGERFSNPDSLDRYLAGERKVQTERLTPADAIEEAILLETRTGDGIDTAAFSRRYGIDLAAACGKSLRELKTMGLLRDVPGRIALTDAGFDVHNAIVLKLVTELARNGS